MMQLFHFPWAPYARKALLAGYELESEFEEVITPAFDKSVMAALRARTSPLATMPLLLLDDGSFVSESSLIVEYFDLASPESRSIPTPRSRSAASTDSPIRCSVRPSISPGRSASRRQR